MSEYLTKSTKNTTGHPLACTREEERADNSILRFPFASWCDRINGKDGIIRLRNIRAAVKDTSSYTFQQPSGSAPQSKVFHGCCTSGRRSPAAFRRVYRFRLTPKSPPREGTFGCNPHSRIPPWGGPRPRCGFVRGGASAVGNAVTGRILPILVICKAIVKPAS